LRAAAFRRIGKAIRRIVSNGHQPKGASGRVLIRVGSHGSRARVWLHGKAGFVRVGPKELLTSPSVPFPQASPSPPSSSSLPPSTCPAPPLDKAAGKSVREALKHLEIWNTLVHISHMILRTELMARVAASLQASPITGLLGPRQCGKTTLALEIARQRQATYFDLEDPEDQARLENPKLTLGPLKGLVVLDEIQRRPGLLPLLRVLADRKPLPARFLLLGSASPELVQKSSETLAGRIQFVDMGGLSLWEVGAEKQPELWVRGGFPPSFVAADDAASMAWRGSFVRTFLERDLALLGFRLPPETVRRFWTMVSHQHGQIWNGSEIGSSLGVSHHTARRYLDALAGAYMVRQLQPWFENVGKRVVRSPKVYVRDSGILHALLNLPDLRALQAHPKLGASWEGFALEQIVPWIGERNVYFWATHGGGELDLLAHHKGRRWGFEFKYQDAPKMTQSLHTALDDLKLEHIWVVYPGASSYALHEKVDCIGLRELTQVRKLIGA